MQKVKLYLHKTIQTAPYEWGLIYTDIEIEDKALSSLVSEGWSVMGNQDKEQIKENT